MPPQVQQKVFETGLAAKMINELSDNRFGAAVRHDADVEAVRLVRLKRSFDCTHNPLVSVAEDTAAEQREVDDSVAGAGSVCHCGGQCGLVRRVENEPGKLSPLVDRLPAVRNG